MLEQAPELSMLQDLQMQPDTSSHAHAAALRDPHATATSLGPQPAFDWACACADVTSCEPDVQVQIDGGAASPDDPNYVSGLQWDMPLIDVTAVWQQGQYGSAAVKVCMVGCPQLRSGCRLDRLFMGISVPAGWTSWHGRVCSMAVRVRMVGCSTLA